MLTGAFSRCEARACAPLMWTMLWADQGSGQVLEDDQLGRADPWVLDLASGYLQTPSPDIRAV